MEIEVPLGVDEFDVCDRDDILIIEDWLTDLLDSVPECDRVIITVIHLKKVENED